ncbi:hypothetical protein PX554_06465 [Sphingomonas sp. H39-1-10]|uniref:hypothetical protein n=1 Tax=Sphingomonas pollutisoli TaxID=3030829 RepID=UPI0023B94403|nr:hypothetical protein [Sphingomonas pollutisoli]MDF0487767.1 hypothetical protein [Sphingomonas pollutisoli]
MKLPFLSARRPLDLPPLDSSAGLPLILAGLLCAALAFQLTVVDDVELPPVGPVGAGGAGDVEDAVPAAAGGGPAILARSMFAPSTNQPAAPGQDANPLGGIMIAGSLRMGRAIFAVVMGPNNRVANVPVGGRIGDWRLTAIRQNEALLTRGEEQITVPFGARSSLPATAAATRSQ